MENDTDGTSQNKDKRAICAKVYPTAQIGRYFSDDYMHNSTINTTKIAGVVLERRMYL